MQNNTKEIHQFKSTGFNMKGYIVERQVLSESTTALTLLYETNSKCKGELVSQFLPSLSSKGDSSSSTLSS